MATRLTIPVLPVSVVATTVVATSWVRGRSVFIAFVLFVCGFSHTAHAHPQSGSLRGAADPGGITPGQRIEAQIEAGVLHIDYYAEVATMRIYQEARKENAGPDWALGRVEELRGGVRARWDGQGLALLPVHVEKPVTTGKEADFVEFHLAGQAVLPADAGELQLEMGNFPDEPSYLAVSVKVAGDVVVEKTSLAKVQAGNLRDNVHGAWRRNEAARVATLTIRPAHVWERGSAGPLPSRLAGMIPLPIGWKLGAAVAFSLTAAATTLVAARRWASRRKVAQR